MELHLLQTKGQMRAQGGLVWPLYESLDNTVLHDSRNKKQNIIETCKKEDQCVHVLVIGEFHLGVEPKTLLLFGVRVNCTIT